MVEFQEQTASYAKHYHANGQDKTAESKIYLEGGTIGNHPTFGGKGAAAMGLGGPYDRVKFLAAIDGRYEISVKYIDVNYKKGNRKGAKTKDSKEPYAFGEFVLSDPKSFSIAIGMAKGDVLQTLKGIVDKATAVAAERIEEVSRCRITTNGVTTWTKPVGIQWTNFDHMHNRRGDSHTHRHIAVMRHAMCEDGTIRTLDMSIFMQAQKEIDAVYKMELTKLCAEAGFQLDMTENGPELRQVPKALRAACSKGTDEIAEFLKGQGIDFDQASHNQKDWANAMTKAAKVKFSEAHIETITRAKFKEAGFDYDKFVVSPEGKQYKIDPERSVRDALILALEDVHERNDVIKSRYELAMSVARYQGWAGEFGEIVKEIDAQVASGYLLFRGEGTGLVSRGAGKMTSKFAVEREKSAVDLYKRGIGRGIPVTDAEGAQKAIDDMQRVIQSKSGNPNAKLSDGQVQMINSALTTPDRIMVCEGDPGTGKTTGMEAVKNAAEAAGWKVVGFAPSDQARDALTSSGVKSETVQFATKSEDFWKQIDHRTILIVDEAGMVDAGEMRILLQRAEALGARVLLVGDRKQLQSVGAGSPYARVATYASTRGALVHLDELNRAKTVENKSLHLLSRDDQVGAIQKLMQPGIGKGDIAVLRDTNAGPKFVDIINRDGTVRKSYELDQKMSAALKLPQSGVHLTVSSFERDTLTLADKNGVKVNVTMRDGGPAGKVFSSSDVQERYEYLAGCYANLTPEERFKTPIIVDTNKDREGVTECIRAKLGIKSVVTIRTFESRNLEVAKHKSSTFYTDDDYIKINTAGYGFSKGDLLKVTRVDRDKLTVTTAGGVEKTFIPSIHGKLGSIGEVEKVDLGVGDFVRFSAKWKAQDIRNGDRGIIREIDSKGMAKIDIIDWDGKLRTTKDVNLGAGPTGIRSGYSSTVHSLQGGTMDYGFYLAGFTSRNSFLVGLTRFRYGMTLVCDVQSKEKLVELGMRVQKAQTKEAAMPTAQDISNQKQRNSVNSAFPSDINKLRGPDGMTRFSSYPKMAPINEENVRYFLKSAKETLGTSITIDGDPKFVKMAQKVAKENQELGVTVIGSARVNAKIQAQNKMQNVGLEKVVVTRQAENTQTTNTQSNGLFR